MDVKREISRTMRKLVLGRTDLPQACDISLDYPQIEINVRLLGMGVTRDVTHTHSVACAVPFTFCIGLELSDQNKPGIGRRFTLEFRENQGEGKLLGVITLKLQATLQVENHWIGLFEAVECRNYCISRYRLLAHQFLRKYKQSKGGRANELQVSTLDAKCNCIAFICPRPVVLVCVVDGFRGNVFPMNLLGGLGGSYFAFALNSKKQTASLVERLGRLTLSTVPLSRSSAVRELGKNHYLDSIPLEELPFALQRSGGGVDIPFPQFAIRVVELQVIEVLPLGSHHFFLAKTVGETVNMPGQEFHMIHGFYAAHRNHCKEYLDYGLPGVI